MEPHSAAGGASGSLVLTLTPYIVGGVFVLGLGYALYTRAKNPAKYEILGRIVMEDAQERSDEEASVSA